MSIKRTSKFIFTAGVILTILTSIFHMSALVSAQTISDDPIATAQQYLDKATVKHSFKSSKSLQEAKDFLSTKSYENGSSLGIIKINVGLNTLDIPVNLDLAIDNNKFNEQVTQFKNTILEDLLRIKTDSSSNSVNVQTEDSIFGFDYNPIEISKKFSVDELNLEIKNSPTSTVNFNINSVLYVVDKSNPEAKLLKKEGKNSSKKTKIIRNKNEDLIQDSVQLIEPTDETKAKILGQAKETKAGIERKKDEIARGVIAKEIKKQKIEEENKLKKIKLKEIQKLIKEGKKSKIDIMDVYFLGSESEKIGLKISENLDKEGKPSILLDETKTYNYKEDFSFIDYLLKSGSINASAFSPERTNETFYHSKAFTGYGTALELYNGDTTNGAKIGLANQVDGNTNQQFNLNWWGEIKIKNKCLDLASNNRTSRAQIQLWDCNGKSSQKWVYDTEMRLRLKDNTYWCVDANSGSSGQTLFLDACNSATETFRSGPYEMVIMDRKPKVSGNCNLNLAWQWPVYTTNFSDCGHTFVYLAAYNKFNNVQSLSTFSKWDGNDNVVNNNQSYKAYFDKQEYGGIKIHFNNTLDLPDAYKLAQSNNFNSVNGSYSYWTKSISYNQWNSLSLGGFKNGYSTGYNASLADLCTTYARDLWQNNGGIGIGGSYNLTPESLYNTIYATRIYDN